ncbi:MAG: hypothetical protein ACRDP8_20215 [Actinopolymorphaceae bacterium]
MPTGQAPTRIGDAPAKPPRPNPIAILTRHFETAYRLVNDSGRAYAIPGRVSGHQLEAEGTPGVALPVGAELRRKIVRVARHKDGCGMIGREVADKVLLQLEAKAFETPPTPLSLRFAERPSTPHDVSPRVWLDLGRADGQSIVVRRDGWRIEPGQGHPEVVWRRTKATGGELPMPVHGGRLVDLAPLLDLDPDGDVFACLLGWVLGLPFVSSVRPGILLLGPPGSGKSTRLRLAASVFEPSDIEALGKAFGRNIDNDEVRALHRAVPLWDNLGSVSTTASDSFCCLVTGTAREGRTLYTNDEISTQPIRRPIGMTAVGQPAGFQPDALDRLIVLEAPPVVYKDDATVQTGIRRSAAEGARGGPRRRSVALRWRAQVKAPTRYRMAAHAHLLTALDAAVEAGELPGCPRGLLDRYGTAMRETRAKTVRDDSFGGPLLDLLEKQPDGTWQGTATELLGAVAWATGADRFAPGWPKTARAVPNALNHLRGGLADHGATWTTTTVRGNTTPKGTPYSPWLTCAYSPGGARGARGALCPGTLSVLK